MKVVVIGGTGLIGSKLVAWLQQNGLEAVPASPGTGVDTLTGLGLAAALDGADAVVDVSNSPSYDEGAMDFFETSTRNLLAAEAAAGVAHHVALSVVGTGRLSESAYFRAKIVQEYLVTHSPVPWSLVHATQFFEFLERLVAAATVDGSVRLAPVAFRPMGADDVARMLAQVVVAPPLNRLLEVAGPQEFRLDELFRGVLGDREPAREVIADPEARYFGARLGERTLVPEDGARKGELRLEEWIAQRDSLRGRPPRQEFLFTR